ncbi:hypothetical protein KMW28_23360 [Flammeovirga yaeyamensis]|uniref:Uncharacterized protein n=1 Tax=Flammeovirga yaeyamensis TaxID=367791 RepID=A0AAX1NFD8_9BACT|nr:hypothetical protein [Flammeovirga yaeyamensis]MBB3696692.1 hypothetical protein [Flammeovirga yaeyamensis]NMF33363.1 hypothetical protein [Flammeovirga yaeyamensis]QWG05362.1 hypothetical protein KMW28_23360 [Flammeovirga yaeyamensis]
MKLFILILLFFLQLPSDLEVPTFELEVKHPGIKEGNQVIGIVENDQHQYSTNVASVICYTNQCKIITVTLEWDMYSDFKKLIIPKDQQLEKYVDGKAMDFDAADYRKLNEILRDPFSKLGGLTYEDLQVKEDDLDGYSGATREFITDKDVVVGATLSCFTLWHWVNNEKIKNELRNRTVHQFSEEDIRAVIQQPTDRTNHLLLDIFNQRAFDISDYFLYFLDHTDKVFADELKLILKQINYDQKIALLDATNKQQNRLLILNNLFDTETYHEEIIDKVKFDDFNEVNAFIDYLTTQEIYTEDITEKLLDKLSIPDVVISRSIYWYLKGNVLTKPQNKVLKRYERANKQYL